MMEEDEIPSYIPFSSAVCVCERESRYEST